MPKNRLRFFNLSPNVCLLAVALTFVACQNEEPFAAQIDPELTLVADSSVIEMMQRTASNDGSYDNIIDGASCIGIQFPYDVIVNDTQLTVASEQEFILVEKILDAVDATQQGDDQQQLEVVEVLNQEVKIVFPVTVTLSDHSEIVIDSENVFEQNAANCVEGGDDIDIECIDMVYPIGLFTYNPNLEQTGSIVVNHDKELLGFLAGLAETELVGIDFPMMLIVHDSTELSINSNTELANAMQAAIDSCDEDDDDDYNDDDFSKESLDSILVGCPWSIKTVKRSNMNLTDQYQTSLLIFSEDGTVVSDNGLTLAQSGDWSVALVDFKVFVTIEFKDALDLNGSLYTYEIGENLIKMDGGESDEMVLEQDCGFESQVCDQTFIQTTLQNGCRWSISDGTGTTDLENVTADFANSTITAYDENNTAVDQGNWTVIGTTIAFNGLSEDLERFAGDWQVVACSEKRFSLRRGDEALVLVANCDF